MTLFVGVLKFFRVLFILNVVIDLVSVPLLPINFCMFIRKWLHFCTLHSTAVQQLTYWGRGAILMRIPQSHVELGTGDSHINSAPKSIWYQLSHAWRQWSFAQLWLSKALDNDRWPFFSLLYFHFCSSILILPFCTSVALLFWWVGIGNDQSTGNSIYIGFQKSYKHRTRIAGNKTLDLVYISPYNCTWPLYITRFN